MVGDNNEVIIDRKKIFFCSSLVGDSKVALNNLIFWKRQISIVKSFIIFILKDFQFFLTYDIVPYEQLSFNIILFITQSFLERKDLKTPKISIVTAKTISINIFKGIDSMKYENLILSNVSTLLVLT